MKRIMSRNGNVGIAGISGVAVALIAGAAFIFSGSPWWGTFFVGVAIVIAIITGNG